MRLRRPHPSLVPRLLPWAASWLLVLLWGCAGPAPLEGQAGRDLAPLQFAGLAGGSGYGHLGLPEAQPFRLGEVTGELLALELFNSHCPACRVQSRALQAFYETVTASPEQREVRVLAVGMGDREEALEAFRTRYQLTYPMAPDPGYRVYEGLGAMTGTPTTLFLTRGAAGDWRMAGMLRGLHDRDQLLAEVSRVQAGGGSVPGLAAAPARYDPPLGLDAVAQERRVLALFRRVDPTVTAVRHVDLGAGERVFRAVGPGGGIELFARIASRNPPCDVCHTTHLAVAFDRRGVVLGIDLIHAPKAGNVPFDSGDREAVRGRLVGKEMSGLAYDPTLDAVATATITTGVIYDEVRRTAALLTLLP